MTAVGDARDVPLEERLRQKKNGFAASKTEERVVASDAAKAKRSNKNQPLELSSKRAVTRFRQVVEVKKRKVLDPRFEAQSGRLNEDLFHKSYAFLDQYKQRELQELHQKLKRSKSATEKEELKHEIALRSQEMKEKQKKQKIQSALTKRKREEREARKDKKKVELQAKFQDLQDTGRLSKFMAKKRKKNASKDHRWLPTQRK
ncbi:rRNA biogenesis protein rrp36 [Phytophthora boehmeriae]|uniref:rRNA biogenesis protein RRP36 n=1 Tax=Phytophthora boehmeriae TaxID=109152 RepID=A0A8T1X553_9STRA|nr:rRNA biogenesis protein rrp36 [Phytophthora boehmeriae]